MTDEIPKDEKRTNVTDGAKVTAKLKRGTGTRDQDTLKLEGRGETPEEAAQEFDQLLTRAEEAGWTDRLRNLQAEGDADE